MYPAGHPAQEQSAEGVAHRLAALLAERPSVSIGVARQQLVIEGVATDARQPVLRSLAIIYELARKGDYTGALELTRHLIQFDDALVREFPAG